jgi:hypothetical protein
VHRTNVYQSIESEIGGHLVLLAAALGLSRYPANPPNNIPCLGSLSTIAVMPDGLVDKTDNAISNFDIDHDKEQTPSRFNRNQVKQLVLLLLVVQNVATILSMKQASGIRARDGRQALTTSIVVMVEILKVALCSTEILVRCAPRVCPILAEFLPILVA